MTRGNFRTPSIDRSNTKVEGILAENTPIYSMLVTPLTEEAQAALAWRDLYDNIWDM